MHRLAADTSRFRFEAGGIDFLVLSFAATEQLSTPFEVQLALAAEQEIAFETVLGQSGLLTICGRDQERLFHGIVHQLTDSGRRGRFHLYAALLKPQAALLAHRRDCRIFQHLNVPQIVAQVFTAAALPGDLYTFRLKERYPPREYCVQYRESDLDFVRRLLAAEGIFFFFEHSPSAHRMVFADSAEAYPPIAGCEQVPFNPGACLVAEEAAVIAFSRGLQITSGRYSHRDFDFKKPNLDLTARDQSNTNGLEVYDYPGGYSLPEQGSRLARVRLQCALAQQDQASGQSVVAHFLPGFTFCLTQADHPDDEIRYLLVQLTHKGEQPQVLSERSSGGQGFSYINDFTAIPATVTFRARLSDLKTPLAHRVQSAIVTGPAGEEIYTDPLGRVKVKFHWDRRKEADEHSSCWIRVSQSWAGAGWGAMHIPRIGQEVLVNFIEGDPDRPIITGRLYHGENPVPETLPDDKTVSGLKSCSTPGHRSFNQLRFEDRKGAEQLCLHAAKEMDLRVANDRRTFIGNDAHTRVHNQMHTQVGGNHHLRVKGDVLTQLAASDTLIAGRDQQHRIGGDFCLEAGQSIDLNALTAMVVEAGARLTLKVGPSFVTIDDSGVSVGGPTIRFIENGRAESGRGVFVSEPEPPQSADHSRPGAPPTRTGAAAARPSAAETPCDTPARIIPAVATAVREVSHKLALEVAGSKKVMLTGTLRAESERGIRKGKALAQGLGDTHRRQIFIAPLVPDRYRLYLDEGDYRIPAALGKTLPTCAEPSFSPRWETILVPIVPRSYTSIDLDRAHADYPRQGYIYIFVSGHLWRELHSDGRGAFADVDLARHKGADARPAMGNAQTAIIVPFQIGGTRPEITICYAEVQWSWAQITALGGMDPADIRHATAPRITPCTDPGKAATYRKERLQPLDLSGYPNFDIETGTVGSTEEKGQEGGPLREDLADCLNQGLPVVYLHDSLGIAEKLVQQYQEKLEELRQTVADLPKLKALQDLDPVAATMGPDDREIYFRSAVLAYRVFFDPQITIGKEQISAFQQAVGERPHLAGKTVFDGGLSSYRRPQALHRPAIFDACAKVLDRAFLENILHVAKRRELRADLRKTKKTLVDFLDDKIERRPAVTRQPDFIPVNAILKDYGNLNDVAYGLLWGKANGLYGHLNHEPCTEDPDLDIAEAIADERPRKTEHDPGVAFLNRLLSSEHPLHACLFPPEDPQVDPIAGKAHVSAEPEPADGSALFRPGAFAAALTVSPTKTSASNRIDTLVRLNQESVGALLLVFKRQWESVETESRTIQVNALIRLAKATKDPALAQMQAIPKGSLVEIGPEARMVIAGEGAGTQIITKMSKAGFINQRPGGPAAPKSQEIAIFNARTGEPIGSTHAGRFGVERYHGIPARITREQALSVWGRVTKQEGRIFIKTNTELVVFPNTSPYAAKYYNPQFEAPSHVTAATKGIELLRRTMPPLIAVLELMNFSRAVMHSNRRRLN
jgi:type VI secretion system secreted protein VgrG